MKIAKPGNEETSTSEGFEILANILDFIRQGYKLENFDFEILQDVTPKMNCHHHFIR